MSVLLKKPLQIGENYPKRPEIDPTSIELLLSDVRSSASRNGRAILRFFQIFSEAVLIPLRRAGVIPYHPTLDVIVVSPFCQRVAHAAKCSELSKRTRSAQMRGSSSPPCSLAGLSRLVGAATSRYGLTVHVSSRQGTSLAPAFGASFQGPSFD